MLIAPCSPLTEVEMFCKWWKLKESCKLLNPYTWLVLVSAKAGKSKSPVFRFSNISPLSHLILVPKGKKSCWREGPHRRHDFPSAIQDRQEYSEFLGERSVPWGGVELLSKQRGWLTVGVPGIFACSQEFTDGWCHTFSPWLLDEPVIMHQISRVEL